MEIRRWAWTVLCSGAIAACGGEAPSDDGQLVHASEPSDSASSQTDGDTASTDDSESTDSGSTSDAPVGDAASGHAIKTVWLIVEENHNWSSIKGSKSAPYINDTLLPMGAHAEQYYNPPKNHPSETNYIWMEAGSNLGITNDNDPSSNHQATTDHLVTKLQAAGVTWRSFQESMPDPAQCPLASSGLYAAKHNPMVFFDDVTDKRSPTSKNCVEHVRPFPEMLDDLTAGAVAQYNFVTPNLCNDMHGEVIGTSCPSLFTDMVKRGDDWLATNIPLIMASKAYKDGGAIVITWDEGEGLISTSDGPIGMIVISPFAKKGYSNSIKYTHSSLLRTLQDIFSVTPYLRDADKAENLSDLFTTFP
jgi:hypothetical protein